MGKSTAETQEFLKALVNDVESGIITSECSGLAEAIREHISERNEMTPMPIVTLSNGIRVGNFSSPHAFEFEDGTILPACEPDRVEAGSVNPVETLVAADTPITNVPYSRVRLRPVIDEEKNRTLLDMLDFAQDGVADIVLVSLMMLQAIEDFRAEQPLGLWSKCHCIRRTSRGANTICIDRFCV